MTEAASRFDGDGDTCWPHESVIPH